MIRLLQKYQQWLVCFFASLLLVVFSSVVFAEEGTTSNIRSVDVVNAQMQNVQSDYYDFVNTHMEPNFYN